MNRVYHCRWIPIGEELPEVDEDGTSGLILLSFENSNVLTIGRYGTDLEGDGAFYDGDDNVPLIAYGLIVNAWMPMLPPYREDDDEAAGHESKGASRQQDHKSKEASRQQDEKVTD